MRHPIHLDVMIPRPPSSALSTFRADPAAWLPLPNIRQAPRRWRLSMWAGPVAVPVDLTLSEVHREGTSLRRCLRLAPSGMSAMGRYAPELVGDLLLDTVDDGLVLRLEAQYRPPFGAIGEIGNRLGVSALARRSLDRLLHDIADGLGRASRPAAPALAGAGKLSTSWGTS